MTRNRRITATTAILVCIAFIASTVFFALRADGRQGTESTTNDGGAWLVNQRVGNIGHVNRLVRELSSAVRVAEPSADIEVYQPLNAVVSHDRSTDSLTVVDVRTHLILNTVAVPADASILRHDNGLVIVSDVENRVWSIESAALESVQTLDSARVIRDGNVDAVAARHDGTVFVASPGLLQRVDPTGEERADFALPGDLGTVNDIVIDGDRAILRSGNRLARFDGDRVTALGTQGSPWAAAGQHSIGATGSAIAVDIAGQLLRIDSTSGSVRVVEQLEGDGHVSPIEHQGCIYALTTRPAQLVRVCGDDPATVDPLTGTSGNPKLRLRLVNGWVWINDLSSGALWMIDDQERLSLIDDWGAVLPNESNEDEDQGSTDTEDNVVERIENPDNENAETIGADEFDEDGVNQPPVANDDFGHQTHVDRPIVINLVANDVDPDNDVLLVSEVDSSTIAGGSIQRTVNGTGVQVTPDPGFEGTITFSYTITDGRGGSDTAQASVIVRNRSGNDNRPPHAETDIATVTVGQKALINVLLNDSDPDGDSLVVVDASAPTGAISFDPAGRLIFEPAPTSGEGEVKLSYVIEDDFGARTTGTVRALTRLKDSNQPPDARNDGAITVVSQPVTVNLLTNDTDPDGDDLFVAQRPVLLSPPDTEVFTTISPDGEFVFIPEEEGTFVFSYAASDDEDSDMAQIRVDVSEPTENRAPIAIRDDAVIPLGESRIVYTLQNDGDPDGDVVGIVDLDVPGNSGLRIEDYFGIGFRVFVEDTGPPRRVFRYSISDGKSDPVQAIVVVAIADAETENQPPEAQGDTVEARPGSTVLVPVLDNDFDPEGGSLKVVDVQTIAGARVEIGPDGQSVRIILEDTTLTSFTVSYDVVDERGNRTAAVIRVSVVPSEQPNRPPIARADSARAPYETEISVPVTANDSDPDGDAIRVASLVSQPLHGIATIDQATGEVRYRPADGYSGTDRFSYSIVDALGARATGEVLVGVMPPPELNQDPRAQDDSFLVIASGATTDLNVLLNDSDPDGDQVRVISFSQPRLGEIIESTSAAPLAFTAPFDQPDDEQVSFTYSITDGRGGRASATGTILIQASPDQPLGAPTAVDDFVGPVLAGDEVRIAVVENDHDPNAPLDELEVTVFDDVLQVEGQMVVLIAPEGSDDFTYQITDADGNTASAQIFLDVIIPVPPIAVDDTAGPVREGDIVRAEVLLNDQDPDGDPEALRIIDVEGIGARIVGNEIQLTAPIESADYQYTIEDEQGLTATATLSVIVVENRPPIITPGVYETDFERSIDIDVATLADDPDGDPLFFSCCQSTRNGSPQVLTAGQDSLLVEFTPDAGFSGAGVFSFEVDDQLGNVVAGSVTVIVGEQPNRPPTTTASTAELQKPRAEGPVISTRLDLSSLTNDPDTDDDLTFSIAEAPGGNVTARLLGLGVLELSVSDQSSVGETSLTWSVSDGQDSATGTVVITVTEPENNPPVAQNSSVDVAAGNIVNLNLAELTSDDDANEVLTWAIDPNPPAGITITQTGSSNVTIAAAINAANENTSFGYTVTDRLGEQAAETISVQVTAPDAPPPTANGDEGETLQGDAVTIPVLANDDDPIGQGLTIIDPGNTTNGSVSLVGDAIEFQPNAAFFGTATFTYRIRDAADIESRESAAIVSIEVTGRPDTPTAPTCETDSRLVTLTWTAPSNNGTPITDYRLNHDQGGIVDIPPSTSYTWTGLDNGQAYRFRLQAINAAGASEWSSETVDCVPDTLPERPPQPQLTHGDGWLEISWEIPTNEGSPIESYDVRLGGGTSRTVEGAATTTLNWPGLQNGTDYTFQVAARNARGLGDFSIASEPEHPSTVPQAPSISATTRANLVGAEASGILQINWTPVPVTQDGGDTIIEYRIERSDGATAIAPEANTSSYQWSGLQNGVDYEFRVIAVNRDGDSDPSEWSSSLQPCTVPELPAAADATAGDLTATISITPPVDNGGCEITSYEVRILGQQATTTSTSTTIEIGDLTNGTTYAFEVRANSVVGSSFWRQTTGVVPRGVPICGADFDLTTITLEGATVTWSAANPNGGDTLYYERNDNDTGWINVGTDLTAVASNLAEDTTNTLRIRAHNEIGPSLECGKITFTSCPSAPPAPIKPSINVDQAARSVDTFWNVVVIGCTTQPEVTSDFVIEYYETDVLHSTSNGSPYFGQDVGDTQDASYTDLWFEDTLQMRVRACYPDAADGTPRCGDWSPWSDTAVMPPLGTVSITLGSPDVFGGDPNVFGHNCANAVEILAEGDDPNEGCYHVLVSLNGWFGEQQITCFYKTGNRWTAYGSAERGNGNYNICSFSLEHRRVRVVVNGTIEGQFSAWVDPPAVMSNSIANWPG